MTGRFQGQRHARPAGARTDETWSTHPRNVCCRPAPELLPNWAPIVRRTWLGAVGSSHDFRLARNCGVRFRRASCIGHPAAGWDRGWRGPSSVTATARMSTTPSRSRSAAARRPASERGGWRPRSMRTARPDRTAYRYDRPRLPRGGPIARGRPPRAASGPPRAAPERGCRAASTSVTSDASERLAPARAQYQRATSLPSRLPRLGEQQRTLHRRHTLWQVVSGASRRG